MIAAVEPAETELFNSPVRNGIGVPAARRNLDFIIIGAQKCGTTSLHKYLESHPELYLLPEKEVPYFSNEDYRSRGWDWYVKDFFAQAPPGKLWGKSTPAYMTSFEVPGRIQAQMPDAKLIALLRNPVDRAFSHYKMMVKRKRETRGFAEVVGEKLQPGNLRQDRLLPPGTEDDGYLTMGEYGRILEKYLQFFPRRQLLVLFTEDLERDSGAVLKRVLQFLNVDDAFVPANLGKHYHVGGTKRRIPVDEHALARHRFFRKALEFIPQHSRHLFERRFLFWFMIWNTRPDAASQKMPPEARKRLSEFYREDAARLAQMLKAPLPWHNLPGVQ
jgi:hypothetical protein